MASGAALNPCIALAAYAEPLVTGKRVIVFGDALSGLAETLVERGARLVQVYDADAGRVAEATTRNSSRNVSFAPIGDGGMAVRDGAFDVGVIENLAAVSDAAGLLRKLKRTLGPRGIALITTPNPDASERLLDVKQPAASELDYYGLYDVVSQQFEHVRMLGQAPFVGYAIVDFSPDGEPEPTFDAGLLASGSEQPDYFVALAGNVPARLEDFSVVQLPWHDVLGAERGDVAKAARAAERDARQRVQVLERELAASRNRREPAPRDDQRLDALTRQLAERDQWITQLEARANTADERADETQAELDSEREKLAGYEGEQQTLRSELATLRTELAAARKELEASRAQSSTAQGELEAAQRETAAAQREAAAAQREAAAAQRQLAAEQTELQTTRAAAERAVNAHAETLARAEAAEARVASLAELPEVGADDELTRLEGQLMDRGTELRRMERELREAERIGRELVRELSLARESSGPAAATEDNEELEQKLDRLARANARLEADLVATRWTIEALEGRLRDASAAQERTAALEAELERLSSTAQRNATLLDQVQRTPADDV
jgi:SAM-dependent methyltransferase